MAAGKTGTVDLKGLEILQSNIQIIQGLYSKKEVKKMLRPAAVIIQKAVMAQAPVRTNPAGPLKKRKGNYTNYFPGNLKMGTKVATYPKSASVFVLPKLLKGSAAKEVRSVGDAVEGGQPVEGMKRSDPFYAHMVEFGTKHTAPQPYFAKGFAASKGAAFSKLEQTLNRRLKKAKLKKP